MWIELIDLLVHDSIVYLCSAIWNHRENGAINISWLNK